MGYKSGYIAELQEQIEEKNQKIEDLERKSDSEEDLSYRSSDKQENSSNSELEPFKL